MKCVDKRELLQFIEGKLSPKRLIEVDEHVSACNECKAALNDIASFRQAGISLGASLLSLEDCPEYDDISAYVDGTLAPDRMALMQSHVNSCELCFSDMERIREMRSHSALREKIAVSPAQNRQRAPQGFGLWKRVFVGVAGVAVVATLAVAIGSFVAAPEKPTIVASKPPVVTEVKPNSPANRHEQSKSTESISTAKTHTPERVAQSPGASSNTVLRDGKYRVIKQNGRLALANSDGRSVRTALEARIAAAIEEKLRTGRIEPAKPIQVAMAGVRMRDGEKFVPLPTAPKLLGPMNGIIMSDRPTFAWLKVELAQSYRIRIYDAQFQMVAEETTNTSSIVLPDTLRRGEDYTWRVGVRFSESDSWAESAPAKFHVLSAEDYSSIQRVKRALPGSHLALGAAYESVGLYHEAQQEYRALRRLNRDSSLARKMLYGATQVGR
ncbi:MAG: anti-sigma factor family protein [Armatimonadota bacterium]